VFRTTVLADLLLSSVYPFYHIHVKQKYCPLEFLVINNHSKSFLEDCSSILYLISVSKQTELSLFTAFTYSFLMLCVFLMLFLSQVNEGWGKRMQVLSSSRSTSTVNRSVRTSLLYVVFIF